MARTTGRQRAAEARRTDPACLTTVMSRLASMVHPHEFRDDAKTADPPESSTRAAGWVRASQRLLVMRGLSPSEAGNVVAYMAGLHAAGSTWTVKQIERLLVLRSLVECGRVSR